MQINIGLVKSESQFLLKELKVDSSTVESRVLDTVEIKDTNLNLLFFLGQNPPEGLQKTFEDEEKFYPVVGADSLGLDVESFESLNYEELCDLYAKVNARWILNNNIKTVEHIYPTITYLKDLWRTDRNAFFEELWFLIKTNLGTTQLTAIFHDVKEPRSEKNDKPSLSHSYVTGFKSPQIFEGEEKEEKVMKEYENEFGEFFNITEFDSANGKLVATVQIGLSPILLMARLKTFNQLQKSILIAIFSGLQAEQ
ncbi:MAG: hypothetical protein CME64_09865 [Halobacteriovoraceae bacterium]|nr:hypothetical protein [Halobacteriovoraceae bacterium]|tara:strand:- start:62296 stop:63057 length:762 start_codon:yes stop_codon:yes gene_type:complete